MPNINPADKEDTALSRYVYFYMVSWIYNNNNNFYRVGGIRPENENDKIEDNNQRC
jgi:hypothetical protein